ncbi:hypothetical protein ACU635_44155 [[Actinomadura] parvosata]|uniref:hypothetical protein n=1 Tax=[Actinomadura] parvosata TaxID=1955412 RepID=UPI00406D0F09
MTKDVGASGGDPTATPRAGGVSVAAGALGAGRTTAAEPSDGGEAMMAGPLDGGCEAMAGPVGGAGETEGGPVGAWESVVDAIDRGDFELVAGRVLALDERARREVAAALPAHVHVAEERAAARRHERETRRDREAEAAWRAYVRAEERGGRTVEEHERWRRPAQRFMAGTRSPAETWAAALRVAGAAAMGGPAAVAAWLSRRDLLERSMRDRDTADALHRTLERVLTARPAAWQADFTARAALELRPPSGRRAGRDPLAGLALAMLRHSGAVPPHHDPLVVAWATGTPIAAELREDPLLDHLVPRLFEAEGVGRLLRDERADPPAPRSWLAALTKLQREGRIGRDLLLDGLLRRFLRGGQPADLRFFVRLHELLDPTYDDVSKRRRDYLRLLPAAPGIVAEPALRHLRRLDDLDPGEVTEAVLALLSRGERKLLTAGLTWFDELARDPGADLETLAPALGYAFACESADVQGRAVRLAVKHARRFGEAGARAVWEAATVLPQELGETLASAFGPVFGGAFGEVGEDPRDSDGFVPVPLPPPVTVAPFPAPVTAARDVEGLPDGGRWEAAELWLAGVVRLHASDRAGLASRLSALMPGVAPPDGRWLAVWHWAWEIARLLTTPTGATSDAAPPTKARLSPAPTPAPAPEPASASASVTGAQLSRLPEVGEVPGPHLFLLRRWAEVCEAVERGTLPPYLLAEPTSMTGHLDGAVLVERLEGYERAGVEALPDDLRQALLRLPRGIAPEVVARAGRLTSRAGRAAARWMGGERPEPVAEIAWWYCPPAGTPGCGDRQVYREDREHAGTGAVLYELTARLRTPPSPQPLPTEAPPAGVEPQTTAPQATAPPATAPPATAPPATAPQATAPPATAPPATAPPATAPPATAPPATASPATAPPVTVPTPALSAASGEPEGDGLLGGPVGHRLKEHDGYLRWWPYLMPSDREVVAAHLVPHLTERWQRARAEPGQAWALAVADGPMGEAGALVQAYFVADRAWCADPAERARPLVELAARGEPAAEQVGRQLALLVRRTDLKPGPVFETLESAAALGAQREVWRIMTGFLPVFLPGPGERTHTRHAQGLTFALRAARWAQARGAVACVAEIARRRASNTFVREARRLHTYLT